MSQETDALVLHLEGFDGPLDLLLDLARSQKLDIATISILSLVDQYLAVIEGARRVRLELAADWLVMAAWLTWLKSRLLVPQTGDLDEAEIATEILQARLAELQAMRVGAAWLGQRPQLGWDVFARGKPEDFSEVDRSRLRLELSGLLSSYMAARRRAGGKQQYKPVPMVYVSVREALERIARLLGSVPDWSSLEAFLPADLQDGLPRRVAVASTLIAGLEMAKEGRINLRQDDKFGPILMRSRLKELDHE